MRSKLSNTFVKVVFHKKDVQVAPEPEKQNDENNLEDIQRKMDNLQSEVDELKMKLKSSSHGDDPKAGAFFDAIFNDVEAQQQSEPSTE